MNDVCFVAKPIEVVKGSSVASVVGSTSRFLLLQIDKSPSLDREEESIPLDNQINTESTSHRRSNTVPSRPRKPQKRKASTEQSTHLSPTYKRSTTNSQQQPPFSPSLLRAQPKRLIRVIDDTDDGETPSISTVNPDDR